MIVDRLAESRSRGRETSVCDIVSQPGQFDGYNNDNYKACAKCKPKSRDLQDFNDMLQNFSDGFPVTMGVTFFGNNTAAMRKYFGQTLGLNSVNVPGCSALTFFGK